MPDREPYGTEWRQQKLLALGLSARAISLTKPVVIRTGSLAIYLLLET